MNYSIKRIKKNRKGIFSQHTQETEKIQVEISNIIELHLTNWFNRYCVNKPGMEIRREGNSIAEIVAGQFSKAEIPLYALPLIPSSHL